MDKHCTLREEIDEHPKSGEYWTPIREYHVCEFDISHIDTILGFITGKESGLHLLKMVEEVLGYKPSKSKIQNQSESNRIQFSFSRDEFDLKMLNELSLLLGEKRMGVITKDILESCKLSP